MNINIFVFIILIILLLTSIGLNVYLYRELNEKDKKIQYQKNTAMGYQKITQNASDKNAVLIRQLNECRNKLPSDEVIREVKPHKIIEA